MYERRIKQLTFRGLIGSSGEVQGNCGQGNILPYRRKDRRNADIWDIILIYKKSYKLIFKLIYVNIFYRNTYESYEFIYIKY